MILHTKRAVTVLAALAVALPGFAAAAAADPLDLVQRQTASDAASFDPQVAVTWNPFGQTMRDVAGEDVRRATLTVDNSAEGAEIVLVTIHAPAGVAFATLQDPAPAGWVASWTRTTMQFVGYLGASDERFHLRLLADSATDAVFRVDAQTSNAAVARFDLAAPLQAEYPQKYRCQLLTVSSVGDRETFLPVGTLSEQHVTGARVLLAVFDPLHREYVAADRIASGDVIVTSVGSGDVRVFPLDAVDAAPYLDAAGGPIVHAEGATGVRAATLWDGEDAGDRAWFVQHPGAFTIFGTATVDGRQACEGAYSVAGALTPLPEISADLAPVVRIEETSVPATPFSLVPPETDSDGDGYLNVVELRANSHPLAFVSTPYSDDDGDGVANGRDAVNLWAVSTA